jgi:hypothetical protein
MSNEILEELWTVRAEIARKCNYDLEAIADEMRELEKTIPPERFANRPIRRRAADPASPMAVTSCPSFSQNEQD